MRRIWRSWCTGPTSSTARSTPAPQEAVDLGAPAMRLTLVIEGAKGSEIVQKIIGMMRHQQAGRRSPPIPRFRRSTSRCTSATCGPSTSSAGRRTATTAWCISIWSDHELEGYNKFIPYYLFPQSDLHRIGEHVQFPDQGFGGIESLGARSRSTTTWPRSASATAAAGIRAWARSASKSARLKQARKAAREIAAELRA